MKKILSFTAAALSASVISLSLSGCYFFPEEEKLLEPPVLKAEDVTYSTYKAVKKTIVNKATATGYVVSEVQQDCCFTETDGILKTVYVNAGDKVKKGDLLAEYNTGDLEYELQTQELKVRQAEITYNSTGLESDRLQLEIEKNTLAQYSYEYDSSKLYAPCDGIVSFTERHRPGTEIKAYEVLVRIVDPEKIYVQAYVTEDRKFTVGQSVTITMDGSEYEGKVTKTPLEAKNEGDEDITSVYAVFENDAPGFTAVGTIADISFVREQAQDAIVIPKHLIKTISGKEYVQVLVNGEKTDVFIETGIRNSTEVQVLSGLSEGDEIVVK